LVFSLVIAWVVVPQPGEEVPDGRSVAIYGLLLQDVFGSPSPNGAMWSIAIEAQLYLVLPLMLLVRRRLGAAVLLAMVTVPAVAIAVLSGRFAAVALFERFVPQLAVLFTVGVVAAHAVGAGRERAARIPWTTVIILAVVPPIALIVGAGRVWTVQHYFWVDLAVGPAIGLLLAALSVGRPHVAVRVLDTRPLRKLGSFSYSLYLIHAPIVVALDHLLGDRVPDGVPRLLSLWATAVPLSLLAAWLFAKIFELPFQRHRSSGELGQALRRALRSPLRLRESRTGD
jgi:peptidoglycan/LPS O-acetylase OafA/YrhL